MIEGWTTIGRECMVSHGACLGGPPQDLKFKGEKSFLYIGDNTAIREYAVIHRATGEGEETRVGSHCMIMGATHIAHNCQVGNYVIMSNASGLAGHVVVEDRAIISGMSGVHQFVKIGRNAMVGGGETMLACTSRRLADSLWRIGRRSGRCGARLTGFRHCPQTVSATMIA